jgi:hypothetical protein
VLSAILLVACLGQTPLLVPTPETADAEGLFQRYAGRVVQVRVTSEGSGAKAVIGTGFFVGTDGRVMTNYHVVAQLVFHPDRFRCKVVDRTGSEVEAVLLDIDVLHDLALLGTSLKPASAFSLAGFELAQGARVFSLGNPHDVGLSIVEGTYNGKLSETLYDRIHFTGSINPGMSGGPAIDRAGRVVGVNVASMGNQISFLVPVEFARSLVERLHTHGMLPAGMLKDRVRQELMDAQEGLTQLLLNEKPPAKRLGAWEVPGRWLKGLKEWGSQVSDDDDPWVVNTYSASSDDAIYVDSSRFAGGFWIRFSHVQGSNISPLRLYHRWGHYFARPEVSDYSFEASHDNATNWSCRTDFVRGASGDAMRVAFCIRGLKPFDGLYDVLVRTLSLSQPNEILVGELGLGAMTADNARKVTQRFLEGISWKP